MIYYAKLSAENIVEGYYIEEYHGIDKCLSLEKYIKIDEELHDYLLTLGAASFTENLEHKIYTIADKLAFSRIVPKIDMATQYASLEERISALENALMGVL